MQRATVNQSVLGRSVIHSYKESPRSSLWLLKSLMSESYLQRIFTILIKHLKMVSTEYTILASDCPSEERMGMRLYYDWTQDTNFVSRLTCGSIEISTNCFLVLSRLFWKYSHGLTTGRGGYNSCFNIQSIPIQDLMRMGGIKNKSWLHTLSKQCESHLPELVSLIHQIVEVCVLIYYHLDSFRCVCLKRWFLYSNQNGAETCIGVLWILLPLCAWSNTH